MSFLCSVTCVQEPTQATAAHLTLVSHQLTFHWPGQVMGPQPTWRRLKSIFPHKESGKRELENTSLTHFPTRQNSWRVCLLSLTMGPSDSVSDLLAWGLSIGFPNKCPSRADAASSRNDTLKTTDLNSHCWHLELPCDAWVENRKVWVQEEWKPQMMKVLG